MNKAAMCVKRINTSRASRFLLFIGKERIKMSASWEAQIRFVCMDINRSTNGSLQMDIFIHFLRSQTKVHCRFVSPFILHPLYPKWKTACLKLFILRYMVKYYLVFLLNCVLRDCWQGKLQVLISVSFFTTASSSSFFLFFFLSIFLLLILFFIFIEDTCYWTESFLTSGKQANDCWRWEQHNSKELWKYCIPFSSFRYNLMINTTDRQTYRNRQTDRQKKEKKKERERERKKDWKKERKKQGGGGGGEKKEEK